MFSTELFRSSAVALKNQDKPEDYIFYITPTLLMLTFGATLCNCNFILNKTVFGDKVLPENPETEQSTGSAMQYVVSFASALVFGLGLGVSGMCDTKRVTGFLNFTSNSGWDLTLLGVMGGGVLFNLITFHLMDLYNHVIPLDPINHIGRMIKMDFHPDNLKIDSKLLIGSAIFGFGWGLGNIRTSFPILSLAPFAYIYVLNLVLIYKYQCD